MRRATRLLSVLCGIALALCRPVYADEAARALVRRALEALPSASFRAHLKLSTDGKAVRELKLEHKLINGARSSYLEVLLPPDLAGIRFLFVHRIDQPPVQYVKVAASRRHVLVSDDARLQPFLDSTFYVADVIEPQLDAFDYRKVGDAEVGGRKCVFIEAIPKEPKKQVYGKTVVAIDPVDHLFLRREFYDPAGQLVKVAVAEKVDRIDGNWTILRQQMKSLRDNRTSVLEVTDIKYNVELRDDDFLPDRLLR